MLDPFRIEGPACISFSGGRTSAYMLRRILDAHGGTLPEDVHVLFANTGKERTETLDFVHECETRWDVAVTWLEYDVFRSHLRFLSVNKDGLPLFEEKLCHGYRVVSYETASRRGEPFESLIRTRSFLPNPVMRICTQELKIRPMSSFAKVSLGFDYWTSVVGLRADEPRRVAKTKTPNRERFDVECPLASAGVTLQHVSDFWRMQPFDLQLDSYEGNCDLCFLKGKAKIERTMRNRPDLADWWIRQEGRGYGNPGDALFRHDRPSYAQMLDTVRRTPLLPLFEADDAELPCACTD